MRAAFPGTGVPARQALSECQVTAPYDGSVGLEGRAVFGTEGAAAETNDRNIVASGHLAFTVLRKGGRKGIYRSNDVEPHHAFKSQNPFSKSAELYS